MYSADIICRRLQENVDKTMIKHISTDEEAITCSSSRLVPKNRENYYKVTHMMHCCTKLDTTKLNSFLTLYILGLTWKREVGGNNT